MCGHLSLGELPLQSSLTLVLVPSHSLVQQNLAEWGRHELKLPTRPGLQV